MLPAMPPMYSDACQVVSDRVVGWDARRWWVRDTESAPEGPGPNVFDCGNVTSDGKSVTLSITQRADGVWTSAQIHPYTPHSYGYGTYWWAVNTDSLHTLPDSAVLGLFTWSDDPNHANREIDVEVTHWGMDKTSPPPVWLSVQRGAGRKPLQRRVPTPASSPVTVFTVHWEKDRIRFAVNGSKVWSTRRWVPPEGGNVIPAANLWLTDGQPQPAQVVLHSFRYTPTR